MIGVLLAPGAGAGRDQSQLVAVDRAATALGAATLGDATLGDATLGDATLGEATLGEATLGEATLSVTAVRMDFPYRLAGRRAPDRAPVLVSAVVDQAERLASAARELVLGGRSMGGRMCSMAVAEGRVPKAAGLILISYPLHPPGRPERVRTEHFPHVAVPCLFVSGTRDAFATPAELEEATSAIPAQVTHHWVEGRDHSLRNADGEVAGAFSDWMISLWPALNLDPGGAAEPKHRPD